MSVQRNTVLLSVLLLVSITSGSAFVEELDDTFMETKEPDEIWLIQFYAPWCSFCKQLDPVWHKIGSELRSLGSPIRVGKSDATANTALAKEFKVRNYPAILMLKNNVKYNYPGSRTKDGILDFADRVSGPLVRSLSSTRLFQHAINRHDVIVVYVGATSELKGNLTAAAEELIVHTYFFSASREVLPKELTLTSLPAVLLFKDGTHFIYDKEQDGELKSWIKRERFPNVFLIDSYTLYAMGESGKLVLLALLEESHLCEESLRYKHLLEKVATEHKETYNRKFYFGFMEGSGYIDGLIMGEAVVPSFIVVNLSNDGYFLPPGPIETERHLLHFLDGVLDGRVEGQGGNDFTQRVRRFVYETRMTLTNRPTSADDYEDAPLLAPSLQRKKKLAEKKCD
ncbi:protein disulfide-isomerase TMX3-like isoform X3 [Girardinichthys multiradiatus]|uniref:protein disulfide-isomerase TMX3-like isoform X3 n=1 Tax=Girardinichthys multiradiatus TaxID=208333 RepID=UPI001FADF5BA|nr:protein disulfide-isomerase TMX3-like isoform X3 [Girardinichthys multiradiatus]